MWIRVRVIGAAIALTALLSGCAVGNKHQYSAAQPDFIATSTEKMALAVQDQRPYVLDGDKGADFVGIQRGGFGNPFNVTTESKHPLADDFSAVIAKALAKKKIDATVVTVTPATTADDVKAALRATGANRLVLVALKEWKSDTYTNTALIYDVRLSVLDAAGTVLAETAKAGDENLGGSMMNPPAHAKTAVPQAFTRILAEIFNDPKIVAALD